MTVDPEAFEHLQKIATPLHLGAYVTSDLPGEKYLPYRHIEYLNRILVEAVTDKSKQRFVNLMCTVRSGKALDVNTLIATPDGWSKMGDLLPGDEVFDEAGNVCRVVEAFDPYWTDEAYEVAFSDSSTLVTDGPHNWIAYSYKEHQALGQDRRNHGVPHRAWPQDWPVSEAETDARSPKLRTTLEMHDSPEKFYVPTCAPITLPEVPLPIPPYTLGVWLGDGRKDMPSITLNRLDADTIEAGINAEGIETRRQPSGERETSVVVWLVGARHLFTKAGLLGNKHVPAVYLRGSEEQRRTLLAGLMDTDGGIENVHGRSSFTSQDKCLADAVWELHCSLGARPARDQRPAKLNGRMTGETAYRVTCSSPTNFFRTPRKADAWADGGKGALTRRTRTITSIKEVDARLVRCIMVDSPNHLYLAGESLIPTHNSEYVSKYLICWYLGMFPDEQVILVSYNEDKAAEWGEFCRNLLQEWGPRLFGIQVDPNSASKANWKLKGRRGGMRCVGLGGSITGIGAGLIVIDDPVKNAADADSEAWRRKTMQWYNSTLRTRLNPDGTVVLAMARWRHDDLSGSLLEQSATEGYEGDAWDVIRLPMYAVAPDGAGDDWRDEIGRKANELLWPEMWNEDVISRLHASVDELTWNALYQQDPTPASGGMFDPDNWRYKTDAPPSLRMVRAWDLASKEGRGDWTVGALLGMDDRKTTYILDIRRFRKAPAGVEAEVKAAATLDGMSIPVRMEQERSGSGNTVVDNYKRMLVGWDVQGIRPEASKESRARPLAGQQGVSNVFIVGSPDEAWVKILTEELRTFPRGKNDDIADSLSLGFNFLAAGGETALLAGHLSEIPLEQMYQNSQALFDEQWEHSSRMDLTSIW